MIEFGGMAMTDLDKLIQVDLIAFREQALEAMQKRNPHLFSIATAILAGKKNRVGLEVTTDGKPIGQYTFHLDGLKISHAEPGKLDPQIQHPLMGTVRLYAIMERKALERALADKTLLEDPLSVIGGYLPDITIKFLP
jgi:hypothetical protein